MLETSYTSRSAGSDAGGGEAASGSYWSLTKLRKAYTDYLFSKREELDEQVDARRYYHGSQWTPDQIAVMKKRKQPVMTFNRIARKIDGVTGLIERMKQDPKAYARTPKHEEGADLATAVLRYVLDQQNWEAKSPQAAQDGAIDGIGGIELEIEDGDQGDKDIGFELVDIQSFFYDPRSYEMDFSDARYMGIGKWLDVDIATEMFPDAEEDAFSSDDELVNNTDRDARWFASDGVNRRVRIIDCWYKHKGGWCWAIFSGNKVLMEGKSYFQDEKKKDLCKYIMFSGNVDQDGDRYGFVRNMKSAQDGINARQSKMQHILASRRLILSHGAVDDIEKIRREWARPDGVVLTNRPVNEGVKADDQSFDFAGWTKMLEMNLAEIENFGPNPALIGQGIENKSGRAIALLQQAGIAELGPYILAFRGWKLRVYRAIWNAAQAHWTAERWVRVTDDDGMAQYIQINGLQVDPMTGKPQMLNAIGSLDVDIILDEAPDAITMQGQSFEVLQALGPSFVERFPDIAVELSPLDSATKKKIRDKQQQSMQSQQPVQAVQMAGEQAKVKQTEADAQLKQAQTAKTMMEAKLAPLATMLDGQGQPMQQPGEYEVPPELQNAQAMADVEDTLASAEQKRAAAFKAQQEAALAPQKMRLDAMNAEADRNLTAQNADADRKAAAKAAAKKSQAQR
jgi:hypothetical protein